MFSIAGFIDFLILQAQGSGFTIEPKLGSEFVIMGCITLIVNFVTLKLGNQENQRLLKALHKRFDDVENEQSKLTVEQARMDERQKFQDRILSEMRRTQKFRLPAGEEEE